MHLIDWLIVLIPICLVLVIANYTRRYVRSVADFMAGGRNAGRYLICTARSEQGIGVALFVATFERFNHSGFIVDWWNNVTVPIYLVLAISGFVIYRYRQTRAMTLGQFFEMRYSRPFRRFTGTLAFFAGIVNFGIIPVIGARFFVNFLELPQAVLVLGAEIQTHLLLMLLFLTTTMLMTTLGGQITILVADCTEGMFSQIFFVIVAVALLFTFKWSTISEALLSQPDGYSFVNPYNAGKVDDFNLWYVLMGTAAWIYGTMAWQNQHAFNSSAASPHESKMGAILGRWRVFALTVMVTLLALCAATYLRHPQFAQGAANVESAIAKISDPQTREQMRMPVALSHLLPIGIKGMVCAILLMGLLSGDGIHLHSWGSIFAQDVVMPWRKRPLSTRQHLWLLRLSVVGVAIWAYCFGAFFKQTEYVYFWWAITQAIFMSGAGACIVGGLYWKRGTTAAAWTAMLVGSILAISGILLRQPASVEVVRSVFLYFNYPRAAEYLAQHVGSNLPVNVVQISFFSCIISATCYYVVSRLTCRVPHDMDRLLNRGQHTVETTVVKTEKQSLLEKICGIDKEFSRSDKWITNSLTAWSMFWFLVFVVVSIWCLIKPWPESTWAAYWRISAIWLPLFIGVVTTVWFTIGCSRDMYTFFKRLGSETVDVHDDGTVSRAGALAPARSAEAQSMSAVATDKEG